MKGSTDRDGDGTYDPSDHTDDSRLKHVLPRTFGANLRDVRQNTNLVPVAIGVPIIAMMIGGRAAGTLPDAVFALFPLFGGVVTVVTLPESPDRWLGTGAGVTGGGLVVGVLVGIPVAAASGAGPNHYLSVLLLTSIGSPVFILAGSIVALVLGNVYWRLTHEDDGSGLPESP